MKGFKLLNSILKRPQVIIVGMVLVFPAVAHAGAPYLVKDIKPGSGTGGPIELTLVGDNLLCFSGDDGVAGRELWCSDGTEEGTYLVRDIHPGPNDSAPHAFREVDGLLFFQANDGTTGQELWVSDGTEAGTYMVKDIHPSSDSRPSSMVTANGTLYFSADDGTMGREIWRTDGTADGTVRVTDINPGPGDSNAGRFVVMNGRMFFFARDGVHGGELWGMVVPPGPIPAVSSWGMIVLALLLGAAGSIVVRRTYLCDG